MAQTKLKITLIALLVLFTSSREILQSDPYKVESRSSLRLLYGTLESFPKSNPRLKEFRSKGNSGLISIGDSSDCILKKTGSIESVQYFGIQCDGNIRNGLIVFAKQKPKKSIPVGYFRVLGTEKIGKKNYVKIALGETSKSQVYLSESTGDTEFEYEPKTILKKNKNVKTYQSTDSTSNANLTYFRKIAFDKNRRSIAQSGLEIFFDQSCPLKFKEVDESFYWDNTISYVFEISCVKNTPYAIIRVPGNQKNKLVASNHEADLPEKGDSFYARLKLRKITNERAYWEDFKIYYE